MVDHDPQLLSGRGRRKEESAIQGNQNAEETKRKRDAENRQHTPPAVAQGVFPDQWKEP
jgi:hypothetical protein